MCWLPLSLCPYPGLFLEENVVFNLKPKLLCKSLAIKRQKRGKLLLLDSVEWILF